MVFCFAIDGQSEITYYKVREDPAKTTRAQKHNYFQASRNDGCASKFLLRMNFIVHIPF